MQGTQVTFTGDEHHHITRVMRYEEGDQVIACDGQGRVVLVELFSFSKDEVVGTIIEELQEVRELPVKITLAQGLAKGEKMDLIVQKATELGVSKIIPFTSSRTIVKLNDKKESNRLSRWYKIAKEAAEQSHRSFIPQIADVHSYAQLLNIGQEYDFAFIAYEQEGDQTLHHYLQSVQVGSNILVVIGPEGGFAKEEVASAVQKGFHSISLGRRILRTETAGIVALANIGYHFEYK